MTAISKEKNTRRQGRQKAVLPVRMKGTSTAGESFDDLIHTLDVTPTGIRIGAVRRELRVLDLLTIFYRKRKIDFRVVWIKKLKDTNEFQVGLQAISEELGAWGLRVSDFNHGDVPSNTSATISQGLVNA
jgi:hypothetical protein